MTVGQMKKQIESLDDDIMMIISDGKGWGNIERVELKGINVHIVQETEPLFSDN